LSFSIFHAECAIEYGAKEKMILSVGLPTFLSLLFLIISAFFYCIGAHTARFRKEKASGQMVMVPQRRSRLNIARRCQNAAFVITNTAYGFQMSGCFRLLPCESGRLFFEPNNACGSTFYTLEWIQIAALAVIIVVGSLVPLGSMACLFRNRHHIRERDPKTMSIWGSFLKLSRYILLEPIEMLFRLVVSGVAITFPSPFAAGLICLGLATIRVFFIWILNPYKHLFVFWRTKSLLLSTWFPRMCAVFHVLQQAVAVAITVFPGWEFYLGVFYALLIGIVVAAINVVTWMVFMRRASACRNKKTTVVNLTEKEKTNKKKETSNQVLEKLAQKAEDNLALFEKLVTQGLIRKASNQLLLAKRSSDKVRSFVVCFLIEEEEAGFSYHPDSLLAKLARINQDQMQSAVAPVSRAEKNRLKKQLVGQLKQVRSTNKNRRGQSSSGTSSRAYVFPRSLSEDQLTLKRIARQALIIDCLSVALQAGKHINASGASPEKDSNNAVNTHFSRANAFVLS